MNKEKYIKLPTDYDGDIIHIGDVLYGRSDCKRWKVVAIGEGDYSVYAVHGRETKQLKPKWLAKNKAMNDEDVREFVLNELIVVREYKTENDVVYSGVKAMVPLDIVFSALNMQRNFYNGVAN